MRTRKKFHHHTTKFNTYMQYTDVIIQTYLYIYISVSRVFVERQILILLILTSFKFFSKCFFFSRYKNGNHVWSNLSSSGFLSLSMWNEREKRRFVARYKKNPGLDKLLDFRFGCSREEGSRGRQRERGRKGERGRTRAIETGDR